jgi:pilus assembly protein Flp/PilA
MTLLAKFRKLLKRNDGATAIEYGLIAAGIALAIIPAVQLVGTKMSGNFDTVGTSLSPELQALDDGCSDPSGEGCHPIDPQEP